MHAVQAPLASLYPGLHVLALHEPLDVVMLVAPVDKVQAVQAPLLNV